MIGPIGKRVPGVPDTRPSRCMPVPRSGALDRPPPLSEADNVDPHVQFPHFFVGGCPQHCASLWRWSSGTASSGFLTMSLGTRIALATDVVNLDRITETTDGKPVEIARCLLLEGDLGHRLPDASCLLRLKSLSIGRA
jgi:hypothetical protein